MTTAIVDDLVFPDPFDDRTRSWSQGVGARAAGVRVGLSPKGRVECGVSLEGERRSTAGWREGEEPDGSHASAWRLGPYLAVVPDVGPRWGAWVEGGAQVGRRRRWGEGVDSRAQDLAGAGGLGVRWYPAPRASFDLGAEWLYGISSFPHERVAGSVARVHSARARVTLGLSVWWGAHRG